MSSTSPSSTAEAGGGSLRLGVKFGTIVSAVCAVVLAIGLLITGASFWITATFERAIARSEVLMSSMRHHMTADMMHDTMRGGVYKVMYAGTIGDAALVDEVAAELTENGEAFRGEIAAQDALDLPPAVREALTGVVAPLGSYIDAAQTIASEVKAGRMAEATALLPAFDEAFSALETDMSSVSDAIESFNLSLGAETESTAATAAVANWMALGIILLLVGGLLILSRRLVVTPLSAMTRNFEKLSQGDLDVEVEENARVAEIAAMARVMKVYGEALQNRAELSRTAEVTAQQDRERAAEGAELTREIGAVVDAAVAGDFSRRVEGTYREDLQALAGNVNALMETVDRGIGDTGAVLAALAHADLTKRMEGDYRGALGRLRDDTNAVCDKLREIVGQLRGTSNGLKTATREILSGANDLSERTTKQAATIEETSAAMEQLASTVMQNAERAREASDVAGTVTRTAEQGGKVMSEATEAMERITTSSSKISNIIGLIDDIAFQTNLLALNASVEAARAGEAGKGFAVVAVEVRRLAQSAAEASSEVKALIEQSAGEVKSGSKLVADAATRLEEMLAAARSSNELMDGIARESREQASAIEEVNAAVRTMDEMTQHNAALVEETNAAIEQTEAQAVELDRVVDIFTVGEAGTVPAKEKTSATGFKQTVKALQERVKTAAKTYLTQGSAAVKEDWSEF